MGDTMDERKSFKAYWDRKRANNQNRTSCLITVKATTVQVAAPPSDKFRELANSLAGRWRYRSWVWVFRLKQLEMVKQSCKTAFGSYKMIYERRLADGDPGPQISPEPPPDVEPPDVPGGDKIERCIDIMRALREALEQSPSGASGLGEDQKTSHEEK